MKANNSSLPVAVERAGDAIVVLAVDRSVDVFTSIPIAADAVPAHSISKANPHILHKAREAIPLQMNARTFVIYGVKRADDISISVRLNITLLL